MKTVEDSLPGEGQSQPALDSHAGSSDPRFRLDSGWSALMDGSLAPAELDALFAADDGVDMYERWERYQLVGDALRGQSRLVGAVAASDFVLGIRGKLLAETATASSATVVQMPRLEVAEPVVLNAAANAANDTSFRWKMLAMAASVTAVLAVSWSLLGAVGVGDVPAAVGPVIASTGSAPVASAVAPLQAEPVVVNTTQGPLIRDARLEALMAEHRQYGGMSALQMPAGFLRNATYDAPER